jgi:K+-transporting ATPase A subunit
MIGLAGPAFVASAVGAVIWIAAARGLPRDEGNACHGAAVSYPSIGGQGTGAT